jgi:signal transduction histidine kinase/FixJ family two-component response regulator
MLKGNSPYPANMSPLLSQALQEVPVSVFVISLDGIIVEMNDIAMAIFMNLTVGDKIETKLKDQNNNSLNLQIQNQGVFLIGELRYHYSCGMILNEGKTYRNMFVFDGNNTGNLEHQSDDSVENRLEIRNHNNTSINHQSLTNTYNNMLISDEEIIRDEEPTDGSMVDTVLGEEEAEEIPHQITDQLPCGIVIVNRQSAVNELCNANAIEWLQLKTGQNFINNLNLLKNLILDIEECDKLISFVHQQNKYQLDNQSNFEISVKTMQGKVYSFKCHISLSSYNWIINDITKISMTMEEKHSAMIRYMRCTSHDMRTPMQAISLAAHSLSDESIDPKNDIETIISSSAVLETILSNILEFKTIGSMKLVPIPKPVDVRENLDRIVHILKHSTLVNEGVVLRSNCTWTDSISIEADAQMLDRIVLNLVTNALKFTHQGTVQVTCSLEDSNEQEVINRAGESSNERMLKIDISDTGCGMDETSQAHVGELDFFSGEAGGFGLGTFIVRTYIQALRGKFYVESAIGVGTTMTVEIPTKISSTLKRQSNVAQRPHAKRSFQRTVIPVHNSGGRVLVVEDINVNRKLIVKSLLKGGFEVDQAENGAIALKMMLEKQYQTVFMDIEMPVMTGDVAVREYWKQCDRNREQHPRIVMLTGNITDTDREMSIACGAHEFLTKPVVPKQLWAAASRVLSSTSSEDQTDEEGSPKNRQRLSSDEH